MTAQEITLPPVLDLPQIRSLALELHNQADDRPVVVRGSDSVFCEGLDLGRCVPSDDMEYCVRSMTEFVDLLLQIRFCGSTTIAVIEGRAAGGGLGIAAACDVLWATPGASFCMPEVHVGLSPNVIFPLLRRRISDARLCAMALDGLSRDPQRMQVYGLVDEIVESAELAPKLRALLRAMARAEPAAAAAVKTLGHESALREEMLRGGLRTAGMLAGPAVRRRILALQQWGAPWRV